ncbi:MAG: PhzF family phenazine biosynthesis protein, partial [Pirellulales bacterium]
MVSALSDAPALYIVDAFADRPFTGNPAAVCLHSGPIPEQALQALGAEMNLSETAFVWPEGSTWRLRWFTPTMEVDLCGHATLAAAHILWETGAARPGETIEFVTLAGELTARQAGRGIELNFPTEPAVELRAGESLGGLVEALRLS